MKILAIDLGKYNSVACLFNTTPNQSEFETIATQRWALEQLLNQTKPDQIVIETSSITGWVHDFCQSLGYQVLVANPSAEAWRWKHVKRKTDKDDALKLAKLTALEQVSAVHGPVAERRQYRLGVKYRKTLVNRINRIQNHIRALFDHQGISIPSGHKAWTAAGIETLSQYRKPLAECQLNEFWRGELDLELQSLDALWQQLQQVDEQLEKVARQDEQVQLLQTIPGVGRRTAEVIVAALDNPHRFKNARQVSAYAGLVPDQRQSGQTNRLGRITCRGSRILRSACVEVAWVMLRYNPWAESIYQRIYGGQKTRKKIAIIAVARKRLVRCWAMLRHKQPWQDSTPLLSASTSPSS
ncbi:IS110 family transposase [Leptolyngbya sp. NK1-12]|uniref:IS110 family transposase n=1 Tax=Leptolyngbya sp. NK1-12 TaxID=2547451 RepID=A0AA97AIH3_9CYAN|nr:IS110 family transposase [Leptolyngbya sp. NK1-12]WNZ22158.1 IS110 family transposase [Leptolyngbya sp. NK1-12]WNZ25431.1 IS110 family transposase [Leptolyngbya sp. NK1-12]WNZ25559.1 IS110 family transposase [Leptolyngbya sp. NK1-12]